MRGTVTTLSGPGWTRSASACSSCAAGQLRYAIQLQGAHSAGPVVWATAAALQDPSRCARSRAQVEVLQEAFQPYGLVQNVKLIKEKGGRRLLLIGQT